MGPDADFPPAGLRNLPGFVTRTTPRRFAGVVTLDFSTDVMAEFNGVTAPDLQRKNSSRQTLLLCHVRTITFGLDL
jgi:hypothetical protein